MAQGWQDLERRGPESVWVDGVELRVGSRVVLHPRPGADVFDLVLTGRTAIVEAVEHDLDGAATLAVVVEDDPGRDLGLARQPGHRFFFALDEVTPIAGQCDGPAAPERDEPGGAGPPRILLAGIGNVFLGDDGFGVELVERLRRTDLPPGVEAVDFGVRGMDLAFTIQDGYDAVVLLDATPRGGSAGTLYAIEVEHGEEPAVDPVPNAHGMDPLTVLALVRSFGGTPPPTYVVGCEPQTQMSAEGEEIVATLSEPVAAALEPAVELVQSLLADIGAQFVNRRSHR